MKMRSDLVRLLVLEALQTYFSKREELCLTADEVVDDLLAKHCEVCDDEKTALFVRGCVIGVARFEKLCEGAAEGYCACFKRNKTDLAALLWVAYLLYFCHDNFDASTMRALITNALPDVILDEYISYLGNKEQLVLFSLPVWRHVYDMAFIDRVAFQHGACFPGKILHDSPHRLPSSHSPVSVSPSAARDLACIDEKGASTNAPQHNLPRRSSPRAQPPAVPPAAVREMALTIPPPRPPPVRVRRKLSPIDATRAPLQDLVVTIDTAPRNLIRHPRPSSPLVMSPETREGPPHDSQTDRPVQMQKKQQKQLSFSVNATLAEHERSPPQPRQLETVKPVLPVANTNASLLRAAHTMQRRTRDEIQQREEQQYSLADIAEYDRRRAAARAELDQARQERVLERHLDCLNTAARVSELREQEMQHKHAAVAKAKQREQREELRLRQVQEAARQLQQAQVHQQRVALEQGRKAADEQVANSKAQIVAAMKSEAIRLRRQAEAAEEVCRTERAVLIQEIRLLRRRVQQQQQQRRRAGWQTDRSDAMSSTVSDTMCGSVQCASAAGDGSYGDAKLDSMSIDALRMALQEVRQRDKEAEQARRERICEARNQRYAVRRALEMQLQAEQARRRAERTTVLTDKKALNSVVNAQKEQQQARRMLELHEALRAKREQRHQCYLAQRKAEHERQNALLLRAEDKTAMERVHWFQLEEGIVHRVQLHQSRHNIPKLFLPEKAAAC